MMLLAMGVAGASVVGFAVLSKKEIIHVDPTTITTLSYLGLGSVSLYLLYQLGKVFMLF